MITSRIVIITWTVLKLNCTWQSSPQVMLHCQTRWKVWAVCDMRILSLQMVSSNICVSRDQHHLYSRCEFISIDIFKIYFFEILRNLYTISVSNQSIGMAWRRANGPWPEYHFAPPNRPGGKGFNKSKNNPEANFYLIFSYQ